MRADRGGFTLIELLVALSIGAVVLVGARTLLDGLGSHAMALVQAATTANAEANAERTMRQVVGNLALAPDLDPSFAGGTTDASFRSWCPSARGALEPCRVRLSVRETDATHQVVLSLSTGGEITVRRAAAAELRYLADAAGGGRWFARWDAGLTPPLAIGVTGRDTLVLRIGERR
jgi:prepilin-type N-terminal cleavage/methylation domain-containing protein